MTTITSVAFVCRASTQHGKRMIFTTRANDDRRKNEEKRDIMPRHVGGTIPPAPGVGTIRASAAGPRKFENAFDLALLGGLIARRASITHVAR